MGICDGLSIEAMGICDGLSIEVYTVYTVYTVYAVYVVISACPEYNLITSIFVTSNLTFSA